MTTKSIYDELALSAEKFERLVVEAEQRLAKVGIGPRMLAPGFIKYWLMRGFTPQQLVHIACGRPVHNLQPEVHA